MKIPGIGAIRSLFVSLAFAPEKTKYIPEMYHIGGTRYMGQRAVELLRQYVDTEDSVDLDMTIQLLAALRVMKHGGQKSKSIGDAEAT